MPINLSDKQLCKKPCFEIINNRCSRLKGASKRVLQDNPWYGKQQIVFCRKAGDACKTTEKLSEEEQENYWLKEREEYEKGPAEKLCVCSNE